MANRAPTAIKDYSRFLSRIAQCRRPSAIRVLTDILARSPPTMISLAGGLPNPKLFPFASASIKLKDGSSLELGEERMAKALQYGPTPGDTHLQQQMRDLISHYHNPPNPDWVVSVSAGNQDALDKAFTMLVNSSDRLEEVPMPKELDAQNKGPAGKLHPGDFVLIENPTYSGVINAFSPLTSNVLPVDTDKNGMRPDKLLHMLEPWKPEDAKNPASDIPRVLYTIPNGSNPTGFSLTEERKREIYQIAREYDLIILEDDPYYFLQYQQPFAPSFLSMDVDGRVLRFDSFSKILSSGLRLGILSGPKPLIDNINLHSQVSTIQPSGISQMMVSTLFDKWGTSGFEEHIEKVIDFYRSQKEAIIESCKKHLTGIATWEEPSAGMFLWIKIHGLSNNDTTDLIQTKAMAKQVLLCPGSVFLADGYKSAKPASPYVRAAFSVATPENIDLGIQRLAELIKEDHQNQKAGQS